MRLHPTLSLLWGRVSSNDFLAASGLGHLLQKAISKPRKVSEANEGKPNMGTWCVPSRGLLTISTQGLCPSTRPSLVGVTTLQGEEGGPPGHADGDAEGSRSHALPVSPLHLHAFAGHLLGTCVPGEWGGEQPSIHH